MKKEQQGHWAIWAAIIITILFIIWLHWPVEEGEVIEKTETIGLSSKNFCGYEGNWIHIRVENNSNYKSLVEVCNHEAGHELFCRITKNCYKSTVAENYAKVCENYPRLCLNDEFEEE